ncbi:MAG: hypothetical protein Q4A31_02580 [Corynebacterium sp.]|uniref:hypothetical protein n=1 Tax=Corynebacterium sp. TaxID=1720 RepID=UPI0026DD39FF|nr:hypothetical protein [Corynebacterium sp.]MDO4760791.1 hypothetical protein [Corynebacterium sp.]
MYTLKLDEGGILMGRLSFMDTVQTPEGVRVPAIVYAAWVSLLITAGSAVGLRKLEFPWWVWVMNFLVLLPCGYLMIRYAMVKNDEGEWVMGRRKNLLIFSAISATIFIIVLIIYRLF